MDECVFCKIVRGEISAKKEYEDKDVVVFHDINPKTPVHLLVVPKKHISKLVEATQEDIPLLGKCQFIASLVAKKLGVGEAFRVTIANGQDAGQSVFHIHYHVMGGQNFDI